MPWLLRVTMCFPSRRTVTESVISRISSMRWLTYRIVSPWAAHRRTAASSMSTSRAGRAAVGSSSTSRFNASSSSSWSARTMATIVWSDGRRSPARSSARAATS